METLIRPLYTICLLGIPALLAVTHLLVYRELKNIRTELYHSRQLLALQLMIQTKSKDEPKMGPNSATEMAPSDLPVT